MHWIPCKRDPIKKINNSCRQEKNTSAGGPLRKIKTVVQKEHKIQDLSKQEEEYRVALLILELL